MTKEQIDEIKAIVNTLADQNGWAQLAAVGLEFRKQDLNYGDSLKTFFQEKLKDFFELKKCDAPAPKNPPVYKVKEKEDFNLEKIVIEQLGLSKKQSSCPQRVAKENAMNKTPASKVSHVAKFKVNSSEKEDFEDIKDIELKDWAIIPPWWDLIKSLHDEIKNDERWFFGEQLNPNKPYPILGNYLQYTFVRIYREGKIKYSIDGRYAAFNTGLVNDLYEYIYAIFRKSDTTSRTSNVSWYFYAFSPKESGKGKTIIGSHFKEIPPRANYITNKEDLFIPDGQSPTINTIHIIEHLERLPNQYLLNLCDDLSEEDLKKCITMNEKTQILERVKENISNDPIKQNKIKRDFEYALTIALKRVEWNYKTAIPMYWVPGNSISLLLPLAITNGKDVDLAFVISKQPNGKYVGQTILTLEMAYMDARLIVRPDNDWLIPSKIG